MTLTEYLEREGRGAKTRLHRESGVAYSTIHLIAIGQMRCKNVETAKRISAATGGAVSPSEILGLDGDEAAA